MVTTEDCAAHAPGEFAGLEAGRQVDQRRQYVGEPTDGVKIILQGLACRYKVLPDGRRQIVAYLIPGDICDVRAALLRRMDHSIGTLCPVEVALWAPERVFSVSRTTFSQPS